MNGKWIIFHDSSITGYVIDAETRKPLEGVVVAGLWELTQYFSHGSGGYAKISLVETDKEGRFKIPCWLTFKPWTFNSSMSDGAPIIVIYKPGYKFSHRVLLARYSHDIAMSEEERQYLKETNSIEPAKLNKVSTDKERIQNYDDLKTTMSFPSWHYSKKQTQTIYDALREEISYLPIEKANKFDVGAN